MKQDTTLERCGGCKYAVGGVYFLRGEGETRCRLMPKHGTRRVMRDDACHMQRMGRAELVSIREVKQDELRATLSQLEQQADQTSQLSFLLGGLHGEQADAPPPVRSRSCDRFDVGDRILAYYYSTDDGQWIPGVVVDGYRHHDGCVSWKLGDGTGTGGFAGYMHPSVLLEEEARWFSRHPNEWRSWIRDAGALDWGGEKIPADKMERALLAYFEEAEALNE